MTSYPSELPRKLSEQATFRKFFEEQHTSGQDRWHAVANGLNDYRLKTLIIELEILMQEIHFTLGAIDVQDQRASQFFKALSQVLYRSKNWTTDYDDVKSMMRFAHRMELDRWLPKYRSSCRHDRCDMNT